MKIEYPTTATAFPAAIRCTLTIRDEEELNALGSDFPGLRGRMLTLDLDLDERRVRDWPARAGHVHVKVLDEGIYTLLDGAQRHLKAVFGCVPGCVPGEDGEYVIMEIAEDGAIDGWRPTAEDVVESFWGE